PHLYLRQRPVQGGSVLRPYLTWRDFELHHLATLREHETSRVENLATRRGRLARRELLTRRPRPPRVSLQKLHVRRLPDHREREHGEQHVNDLDTSRT